VAEQRGGGQRTRGSAPKQRARDAAGKGRAEDMRERISAYPGRITYLDLIRKNKRQSALLMVAMVILNIVVFGVVVSAAAWYWGAVDSPAQLTPSIILGVVVGVAVALAGIGFSWFQGSNAILRIAGAREIQKSDDPELFNVVDEMRIAAGLPMPKLYVIQEQALNAFATGRDPERGVVAITTGLRQKLSRDELQGVIAHEMAHIRHLDIRFSMLMATLVGLIAFAADAFLRVMWHGALWGGGRRRGGGDKGGGAVMIVIVVLAVLLAILAPVIARIIQMSYSRQREYLADAGAVELTRNPHGLAGALRKLAGDEEPLVDRANRGTAHMYIVNPLKKARASHGQKSSVFSSHPPIRERVARLMALTR